MPGESFQDMFARVSCAYADDVDHAQRLYDYMSRLWFMPATPILSNGGTKRGLPISCFLNDVSDSLDGIVGTWNENVALASNGGGIGTYWGKVRSIGEKVKTGKTSGIIPFIHVMDGLTLAISQGSLRRGSAAVYLDIAHPEIEEFLEIRKASGRLQPQGPEPASRHQHHRRIHGLREGRQDVRPAQPQGPARCCARSMPAKLWQRILETRLQTGEPYILNIDAVNRALPKHQRELGLKVNTSNLCSEITLPTGIDHDGKERTAVCCLSSLNIETWDQWAEDRGLCRRRAAHAGQCADQLHRDRARRHGARQIFGPARTLGGPGRDGLPLLPADEEHPPGKRHGQVVESAHLQEDTPGSGCGVLYPGRRARRLPGRR